AGGLITARPRRQRIERPGAPRTEPPGARIEPRARIEPPGAHRALRRCWPSRLSQQVRRARLTLFGTHAAGTLSAAAGSPQTRPAPGPPGSPGGAPRSARPRARSTAPRPPPPGPPRPPPAHHHPRPLLGLRGQRDAAPGALRAGHDLLRPVPRDLGDLAHRGGDPLVQRHGTGPWLEQKGVQHLAPVSPGAAPGPCYGSCPGTAAGTAA